MHHVTEHVCMWVKRIELAEVEACRQDRGPGWVDVVKGRVATKMTVRPGALSMANMENVNSVRTWNV